MARNGSQPGPAAEEAFKARFRQAVEDLREVRLETAGLRPRGIVIPAGGARMFTCAWVAVRILRDVVRTALPIQVWHMGPEEMSPAMQAMLAEQQVETVDAFRYAGPGVGLGGFELKSLALLHCPFREVVLMDADNVPLVDPEELLGHASFRETGAVFWPDLLSIAPSSRIWDLCGVAYRPMPSLESGQLAVDRSRAFPAIALSWFMNMNSAVVYQHVYGDKDCFLLAWLALGQPFHLVQHAATRLYGALCQHHPDGRRMFQHRSGRKWKLFGENTAIAGFIAEDACLGYLAELRARWNGRVFLPPPCDEAMTAICEALTAQRFFRLETVAIGVELVDLRPGNLLVRNHGQAATWWLEREGADILLAIGDDHVVSRRLKQLGAGYWRSAETCGDAEGLVLTAEDDPASLGPRGHNSQSARSSLKDWRRNYEVLRDFDDDQGKYQ